MAFATVYALLRKATVLIKRKFDELSVEPWRDLLSLEGGGVGEETFLRTFLEEVNRFYFVSVSGKLHQFNSLTVFSRFYPLVVKDTESLSSKTVKDKNL